MQWLRRRNSPHILCISWLIDGKAGLFAGFAGKKKNPKQQASGFCVFVIHGSKQVGDEIERKAALSPIWILSQSEQIVHAGLIILGKLNQKLDGNDSRSFFISPVDLALDMEKIGNILLG